MNNQLNATTNLETSRKFCHLSSKAQQGLISEKVLFYDGYVMMHLYASIIVNIWPIGEGMVESSQSVRMSRG